MIISLLKYKNRVYWLLFHLLLGILATTGKTVVIVWFYLFLVTVFYLLSYSNVNRPLILAASMVYIGAFEVLARMTKCSPVIPWEASKYIFTVLSLLGIYFSKFPSKKKITGVAILLLVVPSILIDQSGLVTRKDIIFNVLGLINIGIGIIFFSSLRIDKNRFLDLLRLIIYPCVVILIYVIIKTPNLDDVTFSMGAQNATSGDFGSNQVSTVLGLGFFLISVSWVLRWKMSLFKLTDGIIALAFLIQGLFTFSRGGMVSGGISFLVFLFILFFNHSKKIIIPRSFKIYAIPVVCIFIGGIFYANHLTNGKLFLRYQGETYGTLSGTRDKDLETITSGRNLIVMSDIDLWKEFPLWGAGAGTSIYLRKEGTGLAAHVELSRLLAEQGIPGLVIFIVIVYLGYSYRHEKDLLIRSLKMAIFTLAIASTFHSATRTFITPILISMCTLNIIPSKVTNDPVPGK